MTEPSASCLTKAEVFSRRYRSTLDGLNRSTASAPAPSRCLKFMPKLLASGVVARDHGGTMQRRHVSDSATLFADANLSESKA